MPTIMRLDEAVAGQDSAERPDSGQLPARDLDVEALFQASPNPYVILDRALTIVGMNEAYLRVTMRRRAEIIGRNMFDAFPSDPDSTSNRQLRTSFERVLRDRRTDHLPLIHYDIARPDGNGFEERFWSATHTPLLNADGEVAYILQHTVDVTELHRLRQIASAPVGRAGPTALVESDVLTRAKAVQDENTALEDERQRLRALFEQAPGFMAVLQGPLHVFELVNAAYLHLVGNRHVQGKAVRDALPDIEGQGFFELLDQVYASGQPFVGRGMRVLLQGDLSTAQDERFVDLIYQPIRDRGGRVAGIFVQGHDITEQKRAEAALRESEERFRLVAESAPVMLWMGDAAGKCVYLNRALREFWGIGSDDVAEFDWNMTIHPDDRQALFAPFSAAMDTRTGFHVEARYRRGDGEYRLLMTDAQPRFGPDGKFLGMIGVNVDVTEAREAETALRDETHALEVLNQTGTVLAAELDLDQIVQRVTDAGVELTGAQFGAFFYNVLNGAGESYMLYSLSGAPREAFAQYPMPRATKVFAPTFKGEGVVRSDDIRGDPRYGQNAPYRGMPSGHLPVCSYLAVPVASRSGEVLGGLFFGHPQPAVFTERSERIMTGLAAQAAIALDNARLFHAANLEIEQRKRAEAALQALNATLEEQVGERTRELREREEALRHAQKMEVIGQLTGGIAHDFNNLLQVVVGNLEILQRNLPEGAARLRRSADNAMNGAHRAATLTQRLLAFSRRQPLDPRPLSPNRLVSDMSELLHRTLGETIAVEAVLGAGLWTVDADANQLESAILNLAVNARDAMPNGGKLTIETANTRIDEAYALAQAEIVPGQYVVICVSDTGSGMGKDTLARAFEPFFTTKEPGKGTGLGLSMVYGFVKQSGGHVKIYSEVGHGTTVKIFLPRLIGGVEHEKPEEIAAVPEGTSDETILVVEDDDDVRAYSVEILRELGYRVIEAHDGPSALRLLEQQSRIDLLFTDVVLPGGVTGADLARDARGLRPGLRVLFTTGYARDAIVHHGRLDPGVHLITKPFAYADLAVKVRDVLDMRKGAG
jgi:PAS domain S-box-containing protein